MAVKTYDPKQVSVIIGTRAAQGFADGSFVSVDRNEDAFTLLVGADGEGCRAKSNNKSGRVTLTLMSSSEFNDYLSELALADELTGGGVVPLMIKDNSGSSLYSSATAWVVKHPTADFAKEAGTREWVLETDELIMFAGGN
jgi:hypothetical protein